MTYTPAASADRPASVQHAARQHRSETPAEPPRQQAETRAARDRFAARLDRDNVRSSGAEDRDENSPVANRRTQVHERDQDRSGLADSEYDRGGDTHPDLVLTQSITALQGGAGIAAADPVSATPMVDPAVLERMAAQIAEHWPAGGIEAARIQFPEGAVVQSALLTRQPDGSMAIRLTGLDPRVNALQGARLQLDLANALARRRLRIGSLQFETTAPLHRGDRRSDPGAASAIDRVV